MKKYQEGRERGYQESQGIDKGCIENEWVDFKNIHDPTSHFESRFEYSQILNLIYLLQIVCL